MLTRDEVFAITAQGAKVLDRHFAGNGRIWAERVGYLPTNWDLADDDDCIMKRIFGDYDKGMETLFGENWFKGGVPNNSTVNGFGRFDQEDDGWGGRRGSKREDFRDAWQNEVNQRLTTTEENPNVLTQEMVDGYVAKGAAVLDADFIKNGLTARDWAEKVGEIATEGLELGSTDDCIITRAYDFQGNYSRFYNKADNLLANGYHANHKLMVEHGFSCNSDFNKMFGDAWRREVQKRLLPPQREKVVRKANSQSFARAIPWNQVKRFQPLKKGQWVVINGKNARFIKWGFNGYGVFAHSNKEFAEMTRTN